MAQMTEHLKAPEKIQLSEEEIANLSDAQFKTLVIKTLTELVESVRKPDEAPPGSFRYLARVVPRPVRSVTLQQPDPRCIFS